MNAQFDAETGMLLAIVPRPEMAPVGSIARPVDPNGDLFRRMSADLSRFRLRGHTIEELVGWSVVDTIADDRWLAMQRLDAEYAAKMSQVYSVGDVAIPLSAAQALANFLPMTPVMLQANRGDDTVGADTPAGRIVLTWSQIAEHAAPFTLAVADIQSWYQKKRTEIETSADPAGVVL